MRVAGIDSTKGGWVGIELEDGRYARDHLLVPADSDFGELADLDVLAIDIPIGFGPRKADAAARSYLFGAASTVFTTPPREILEMPFGPGLGVSAQSHALGPRILHVTELAADDSRIYEAHPEVSFRAMKRGVPLHYRKKSAGGVLERIELLRDQGIALGHVYAVAPAAIDDVLDAAACAWTAHRIATGEAKTLPEPPEIVNGRHVAIWF